MRIQKQIKSLFFGKTASVYDLDTAPVIEALRKIEKESRNTLLKKLTPHQAEEQNKRLLALINAAKTETLDYLKKKIFTHDDDTGYEREIFKIISDLLNDPNIISLEHFEEDIGAIQKSLNDDIHEAEKTTLKHKKNLTEVEAKKWDDNMSLIQRNRDLLQKIDIGLYNVRMYESIHKATPKSQETRKGGKHLAHVVGILGAFLTAFGTPIVGAIFGVAVGFGLLIPGERASHSGSYSVSGPTWLLTGYLIGSSTNKKMSRAPTSPSTPSDGFVAVVSAVAIAIAFAIAAWFLVTASLGAICGLLVAPSASYEGYKVSKRWINAHANFADEIGQWADNYNPHQKKSKFANILPNFQNVKNSFK